MHDYFSRLFATDFLPHGVCMRWQPEVLWLHVVSDGLIALAYLSIPLLLAIVVRKRKDIPFHWMFLAFGTFILACGATHVLSIVTLWVPIYRLDGAVKALTALASIVTALCLAKLLPVILKIPTSAQLEALNNTLASEVKEKERIARALQASRDELRARVNEQTLELSYLNQVLERNIQEEKHGSDLLREREEQFRQACRLGQVATWVWDLKADKFSVNWAGNAEDEAEYDVYSSSVHPDDRASVRRRFEDASRCAGELVVEYRALRADGAVRWKAARGDCESLNGNVPVRMTGAIIDITDRKNAEMALADSERQFELLADSIPNLAWMAHADGSIFWYNQRWYEFTGTTLEQMQGWGWQSVHDPAALPLVMERWRTCISNREPFEMEFPLRGADGVFHWFLTRITPVPGRDGELIRWFGTNTDVTEIREAREALRESESHFRQIANSLPQLVWIAGPDGSVQWLNQRWYDFTGSTAEQSERDGWTQFTHPEDWALRAANWEHSFATAALVESESRCRRFDGVYRWFLIRGNPVLGPNGEIVKWFGTYTDIEDYKHAQTEILNLNHQLEARVAERTAELSEANAELRRTQTWLRAVLDSATQASIIATDNAGAITIFNSGAEKLLGFTARELVGTHAPFLLDPRDPLDASHRTRLPEEQRQSGEEALHPGARPDAAFVRESVFIHRDGTHIDVSVAHTPMVDSHGERLGTLSIALDIRSQKSLERQLNQNNLELREQTTRAQDANRAKSDFLAVMSHELRTPMNAILGMADLLWESDLAPMQRQYVEVFRRAGANLLTLLNNILDLSKIESGQFELENIDFALADVVDRTADMIRPRAQIKHIDLIVRISPDVPAVLVGDSARLQQILINLLGNAVKFTERGEIKISITADPADRGRLHFEVTDTGIGIPEDKLDSIFSDFKQAESSTTRRFGGTGLGLGICRRLVARMNGSLALKSKLGTGSSFEFDALFEISSLQTLQRADPPVGLVGRRVLIVDNNATNRLIFSEMCSAWGMVPVECADSEAAMETLQSAAARENPFHVVILDRIMPGLDGFELVSRIREIDAALPIIVATSDKVPGDETRSKQLGLAGYAVKPVGRSELLRLISDTFRVKALQPQSGKDVENAPVSHGPRLAARILIAEDSEDNRFLLRAYLKDQPYQLTFAVNGEFAVELTRLQRFDLILMDMQMPVMDGHTATRNIRELEVAQARPQTPILALTANARTEDLVASREAGCTAHLSKPITKAALLRAIRDYIRETAAPTESKSYSINVPEGLEEGAKRYIQSRRNDVSHLIQLLETNEFDQLKILAHNMKGTGTSYGFPDLTRLGGLMEASAAAHDAADLSEQLIELSRYLQEAADLVWTEA